MSQTHDRPVTELSQDRRALLNRWLSGADRTDGAARPAAAIEHVPVRGPVPASPAQEALWFLEQMRPGDPRYNMGLPLRLHGRLDRGALEAALAGLVRRHAALRTALVEIDGRPHQVVSSDVRVPLRVHDAVGAGEDDLRERLSAEFTAPFDLAQAPPARFALFRLGEEEHVLSLTVHHTAGDGASIGLLVGELAEHYRALTTGEGAEPSAPDLTYTDYTRWRRHRTDSGAVDGQIAFWRERLDPDADLLELPTDRPRPAAPTHRGVGATAELDEQTTGELAALARRSGATPFMVLAAALAALLHRCTGRTDIVLGTAVHGRDLPGLERVVGFFVNTLAVRCDVDGDQGFADLLADVRTACTDAFRNQDVPFERVVAELGPDRSPTDNPLFNVLIVRQEAGRAPDMGALRADPVPLDATAAQFDLVLHCTEDAGRTRLTLVGDADLFDRATVDHLVDHLAALAAGAAADPGRALTALAPRDADPAQGAVPGANRAREAQDTVWSLFDALTRTDPAATAIRGPGGSMDRARLHAAARGAAAALARAGVSSGDTVLLDRAPMPDRVAVLLGALALGAAVATADLPPGPGTALRHLPTGRGPGAAEPDPLRLVFGFGPGPARDGVLRVDTGADHPAPAGPAPSDPAWRADGTTLAHTDLARGLRELGDGLLAPGAPAVAASPAAEPYSTLLPLVHGAPLVLDGGPADTAVTVASGLADLLADPPERLPGTVLCVGAPLPPALADAARAAGVRPVALYAPPEVPGALVPCPGPVLPGAHGRYTVSVTGPGGGERPVGLPGAVTLADASTGAAVSTADRGRRAADGTVHLLPDRRTARVDARRVDTAALEERLAPATAWCLARVEPTARGDLALRVLAVPAPGVDEAALRALAADAGVPVHLQVLAAPSKRRTPLVDADTARASAHAVARALAGTEWEGAVRVAVRSGGRTRPAIPPAAVGPLHGPRPRDNPPLLHEAFARQAARTPGAIAVEYPGGTLTYAELARRAADLEALLRSLGAGPGTHVAVLLRRTPDLVAVLLAVAATGAAYVPLDPRTPRGRTGDVLARVRPALLVTSSDLPEPPCGPDTATVVLDDVLTSTRTADGAAAEAPGDGPRDSWPAYVIHTSGSTGLPKGVVVTHGNLANLLAAMDDLVPLGEGDAVPWTTTPSFDMSVPELYWALTRGARMIVVPDETARDPEAFAALIADRGATAVQATPTLWRALLDTGRVPAHVVRLVGAEALPESVARDLAADGSRALNLYGPTETTVWSTAAALTGRGPAPIGGPLRHTGLHVLDERLRPVPPGTPGDLYISGRGVALGYLGRAAATAERFVADPFGPPGTRMYRTGDRVRSAADGGLEFLGRADHQVKVRGYRVEPGEVEQAVEGHPGVSRAVVTVGSARGTASLTAHIVPGADADARARDHLDALRAEYDALYEDTPVPPVPDELTGEPLDEGETAEWWGAFAAAVLEHRPRRILEIGAGGGRLTRLLASTVESCTAVDLSPRACAALSTRPGTDGVSVLPRAAHDIAGLGPFDTVVLNRVVGDMPDTAYLRRVLAAAAAELAPGGRILLGDVADARTRPARHTSAALLRSSGRDTRPVVAEADRRTRSDTELALSPGALAALAAGIDGISSCVPFLREGGTRSGAHRFDALLTADPLPGAGEAGTRRLAWGTDVHDLDGLAAVLTTATAPVEVTGVPDARTGAETAARDAVAEGVGADHALVLLTDTPAPGLSPDEPADLAAGMGLRAVSVPAGDGAFDIRVVDPGRDTPWREPAGSGRAVANAGPALARTARALAEDVRARLADRLPEYMVPAELRVLSELPLTPNGKVDRTALAAARPQPPGAPHPAPREAPVPETFPSLFARIVRDHPDAAALSHGGRETTYARLDADSDRWARLLRRHGCGPGAFAAVALPRGPRAITLLVAVLKTGAAHVAIDPSYPADRNALVLDEVRPAVLVGTAATLAGLPVPEGVTTLEADTDLLRGLPREAPHGGAPRGPAGPDAPAYVIHTSGSTGRPKGVVVPHRGIALLTAATRDALGLGPGARVLQFASSAFDAMFWEVTWALLTGGTLVTADRDDLRPGPALSALAARERITHTILPPTALAVLPVTGGLPADTTLVVGGEECPPDVAARWSRGRVMVNAYGPTETTVCATLSTPLDGDGPPPIGTALPGLACRVLDDRLRPVPDGTPGELYVAGDSVALGYLGRPGLTAASFLPDPWGPPGRRMYRTGDVVRRTGGVLAFVGRADAQVKIRGFRVEPGEVEAALAAHPGVVQAAVVPAVNTHGETSLHAFTTGTAAPEELRDHAASLLPEYMVPAALTRLDALPLTPSAKIDRAALAARAADGAAPAAAGPRLYAYLEGTDASARALAAFLDGLDLADRFGVPVPLTTRVVDTVPSTGRGTDWPALHAASRPVDPGPDPAGPVEREVRAVWCQVLDRDDVDRDADFFDLGGHSLRAAEAVFRLRERGLSLSMRDFFETPTVAGLARLLEARGGGAVSSGVDLEAESALDPDLTTDGSEPVDWTRARDPREVLLTGATGFVGVFLLRRLLDGTRARVHCLVRADDEDSGLDRLRAAARALGQWREGDEDRVAVLPGDLARPGLGLPRETTDRLARDLDLVFHCGADVNLLDGYRRMRPANVGGAMEVLRLAARGRVVPVHHISTTSAVLGAAERHDLILEDADVPADLVVPTGYVMTKWVAERLMLAARERGVPVSVHRLSRVGGDSATGAGNTSDALWIFLRAGALIGSLPDHPDGELARTGIDLVPADHVADAVVALALRQDKGPGRTYHLTHPDPVPLTAIADRMRALGFAIASTDLDSWTAHLELRALEADGDRAVRSSAALRNVSDRLPRLTGYTVDRANTDTDLAGTGVRCPDLDAALIDRYLHHMIDTGFLPRPYPRDER